MDAEKKIYDKGFYFCRDVIIRFLEHRSKNWLETAEALGSDDPGTGLGLLGQSDEAELASMMLGDMTPENCENMAASGSFPEKDEK